MARTRRRGLQQLCDVLLSSANATELTAGWTSTLRRVESTDTEGRRGRRTARRRKSGPRTQQVTVCEMVVVPNTKSGWLLRDLVEPFGTYHRNGQKRRRPGKILAEEQNR